MKQTRIAEPAARTEAAIIESIASQSLALGIAEQEIAALEARRAGMLATGALDEIHALADSLARAKLKIEISQSRVDALNRELRLFYATQERAAIDAEMAPLAGIDAEEREVLKNYEEHAAAVAEALARLQELGARRHQVSVAVHKLTGQYTSFESPTHHGALAQRVTLPSVAGDSRDFWPRNPYASAIDEHTRAARDAAALEEYHRGGR